VELLFFVLTFDLGEHDHVPDRKHTRKSLLLYLV
jgi:hypothetical protein